MGYRLANIDGRAAFIEGDDFYDVARLSEGRLSSDPLAALREAKQLGALADRLDAETPDGQWRNRLVGPPIPNPQKVFGVGLNYLSHADESSMDPPENPLIFTKFPSCLVGAYHEVQLRSEGCDYEGELVVVVGNTNLREGASVRLPEDPAPSTATNRGDEDDTTEDEG